jgi:hypothetical protein
MIAILLSFYFRHNKDTLKNPQHILVELGIWFRTTATNDIALIKSAEAHNGWFTEESVTTSLMAHGNALSEEGVSSWLERYGINEFQFSDKKLGLVLAGNLPLVGWHDMLCGLVAGCKVVVKASRDDAILPKAVVNALERLSPELRGRIEFVEGKLGEVDAVIATGSTNSTRYFESYFGHLPHIFRSQRTGVAILDGHETDKELAALGDDIFTHFGLGCRSTTKIFIPRDFDLDRCFAAWVVWNELGNNNKFANNYDYHKAIWLLNGDDLLENGFLLVKEDEAWVSPVGSLYTERYDSQDKVIEKVMGYSDGLQLVSTREGASSIQAAIQASDEEVAVGYFGKAQCPTLSDYADGIDTIEFLMSLK